MAHYQSNVCQVPASHGSKLVTAFPQIKKLEIVCLVVKKIRTPFQPLFFNNKYAKKRQLDKQSPTSLSRGKRQPGFIRWPDTVAYIHNILGQEMQCRPSTKHCPKLPRMCKLYTAQKSIQKYHLFANSSNVFWKTQHIRAKVNNQHLGGTTLLPVHTVCFIRDTL